MRVSSGTGTEAPVAPKRGEAARRWTVGAAAVVLAVSALAAVMSGARVSAQAAQDAKPGAAATPGAGSSVSSGVYTEEQAKRGEAVSNKLCTSCHGPELTGGEAGPTLVGLEFLGNWNNLSVADFYDRVQSTMPADATYVFKLNKFPAGTTELPTDLAALKGIKIEGAPAAK
jgi:mono/diheme cytochrome c family protein